MSFFKLEDNEHVVRVARRHWLRPVVETLSLLFSLLIPLIISSVLYSLPNVGDTFGNMGALTMIFILTWLFVVWNIAFVVWTNQWLDVLVITNLHIIDIEQIGLWNREISTLNLEKIQDVSSKTEGLIASVLDYGDLEIQTAGSITNFIVTRIEYPDQVRQLINEQVNNRLNLNP
jgi:ABC-type proline/glycine betaine transport system permease subunit